MMTEFVVLAALGVRVREVADLAEGYLYVHTDKLLLVDAALPLALREVIERKLIPFVCRQVGAGAEIEGSG